MSSDISIYYYAVFAPLFQWLQYCRPSQVSDRLFYFSLESRMYRVADFSHSLLANGLAHIICVLDISSQCERGQVTYVR